MSRGAANSTNTPKKCLEPSFLEMLVLGERLAQATGFHGLKTHAICERPALIDVFGDERRSPCENVWTSPVDGVVRGSRSAGRERLRWPTCAAPKAKDVDDLLLRLSRSYARAPG